MPISENMVQEIVQEVMAKMQIADAPAGKHGVFKDMNDAIEAAKKAQLVVKTMSMDQREKIITCIRKKIKENAEVLARMGVEETGMGNVGDKILKHHLVADKTPGTEDITTTAWSGDRGLTLIEMGPFGVIGAITPCTNPSETVLCNTMGMLAGGNTVVFNPHPAAVKTSIYAINLLNEASLESGGPDNIAVTVEKPTLETSNIMMKHKDIHLIAATGGPGVVTAVLSSGKRGIGAGAGNPPAGEQACKEIEAYIAQRQQDMENTGDQSIQFELTTLNQALQMMEQRTQDLRTAENVAMQSIPMIKTMAFSNYNLVRKINSAFIVTLPIFKQALAQAILLKRQKIQADAISELDKKTNEMLIKNAQNTVDVSKATARMASGSSIQIETLEKTWRTITSGIEETQRIQEEARKKRQDDQIRLEAIKQDFNRNYHMPQARR